MNEEQRIEQLERALIAYVEKFGFLDELRKYFLKYYKSAISERGVRP